MPIRLVRGRLRGGERAQRGEHLGLGPGRRQVERSAPMRIDAGTVWSSRSSSDSAPIDVEHAGEVVGGRADVAGDELVVVDELGEGSAVIGWAPDARRGVGSPRCHRYLRASPGAVAGLSPSASPVPVDRTAFQRCLARPVHCA